MLKKQKLFSKTISNRKNNNKSKGLWKIIYHKPFVYSYIVSVSDFMHTSSFWYGISILSASNLNLISSFNLHFAAVYSCVGTQQRIPKVTALSSKLLTKIFTPSSSIILFSCCAISDKIFLPFLYLYHNYTYCKIN